MRLIDADALIDNLELMYEHRDDKDEPYNIGVRGAINMTRKAPTIDVIPIRPQGEWIIEQKGFGVEAKICSVCGVEKNNMSKFCPNCGAKMKGADDE